MPKTKWQPHLLSKKTKKITKKEMNRKLDELAQLIYSSICQQNQDHLSHKNNECEEFRRIKER